MTAASAAVAGTLPVGWDCHAHLFGPYDRYPLAGSAVHAPPPATDADYAALLRRLQLRHGVLVHPSAYGSDHRLLTRCALQLGPKVHITFGIGWDLDPSDGRYDGGGLTLRLND